MLAVFQAKEGVVTEEVAANVSIRAIGRGCHVHPCLLLTVRSGGRTEHLASSATGECRLRQTAPL